jgi:hypothetical protein
LQYTTYHSLPPPLHSTLPHTGCPQTYQTLPLYRFCSHAFWTLY